MSKLMQKQWYIDSRDRTWVIYRIWQGEEGPTEVELLQLGHPETISQPYDKILSLINTGQFTEYHE